MAWQFNGTEAVFLQIAAKLRADIVCGKYLPDSQIPSVRQLAYEASVNPNTMQKALCVLEDEGLLYAKGTQGRFVTSDKDIIEGACKKIRLEAVRKFIKEARTLGISDAELIDYIKEEIGNE